MSKLKGLTIPSVGKDVEPPAPSDTAGWSVSWHAKQESVWLAVHTNAHQKTHTTPIKIKNKKLCSAYTMGQCYTRWKESISETEG